MVTKRLSVVATFGGLFLLWAVAGTAYADDRAFLHYLGRSVYVDDKNLLDLTGESGYAYKGFGDFLGGSAYTGDKTFLGFDGCLENKNTGRVIPDAVVRLMGAGLPAHTRTDHNGNIRASSTSQAEEIRVVISATGYEPYSIIVARSERGMVFSQNVRLVLLLIPLPTSPQVQRADTDMERTRR